MKQAQLLNEEALALNTLSQPARRRGDFRRSKELSARSEQLFRQAGNEVGATLALTNTALIAADEGDYELAESTAQRVIAFFRQLNDIPRLTRWQSNLANTYMRQGNYAAARPLLEEALTLAQADNNRFSQVIAGTNLGQTLSEIGEFVSAEAHLQKSVALAREIGSQRWVAVSLDGLSNNALAQRQWAKAADYAQDALAVSTILNTAADALGNLTRLATAYAELGQAEQALRLLHFVLHHPSTPRHEKTQSEQILANLVSQHNTNEIAQLEKAAKRWALGNTLSEVASYAAERFEIQ